MFMNWLTLRFNSIFPFPEYFLKNDEIIIEPLAQPDTLYIFGADHVEFQLARGAISRISTALLPMTGMNLPMLTVSPCRCNQGP